MQRCAVGDACPAPPVKGSHWHIYGMKRLRCVVTRWAKPPDDIHQYEAAVASEHTRLNASARMRHRREQTPQKTHAPARSWARKLRLEKIFPFALKYFDLSPVFSWILYRQRLEFCSSSAGLQGQFLRSEVRENEQSRPLASQIHETLSNVSD